MEKLKFEQFRECHHFHVLPGFNLVDWRQQVFTQIYERCQNVIFTLQVMKSLPWSLIVRRELKECKENIKFILQDYIGLLLEEDPWCVEEKDNAQ